MPAQYIVRHGVMRFLGEFESPTDVVWKRQQEVVVRTDRGTEAGVVLCPSSPEAKAALTEPTTGQILRPLSAEDRAQLQKLRELQQREYDIAARCIEQRALLMDLVDVEHLLGGERVLFYFLVRPPEKRVDFRELVRDLAREFQTRIEMRQIGVRDEAKVLADYGDCGKPVCCNTHLIVMPPVSMKMAKMQKSTLDPTKISGRCGRLKCCLRYEFDVYEELQRTLPPAGARVLTNKGQGRVLAQEILAQKLLVEFEDGRRVLIAADEVLTRLGADVGRAAAPPSGEQRPPPPAGGPRGRSRSIVQEARPKPPEPPPNTQN
ncbi:MAG TPA: regulatory iron-sulfur-containing complex subunit RicT [Gemmatales bacterium]|nr:regulatory iron-sulfur-containing complex subunit RicT [Gemmatales bacterium]